MALVGAPASANPFVVRGCCRFCLPASVRSPIGSSLPRANGSPRGSSRRVRTARLELRPWPLPPSPVEPGASSLTERLSPPIAHRKPPTEYRVHATASPTAYRQPHPPPRIGDRPGRLGDAYFRAAEPDGRAELRPQPASPTAYRRPPPIAYRRPQTRTANAKPRPAPGPTCGGADNEGFCRVAPRRPSRIR